MARRPRSEKIRRLYSARDEALSAVAEADTLSEIAEALREAQEVADEVSEEYREAASHFGDGGPNADKADACESWSGTLDDVASAIAEEDTLSVRDEAITDVVEVFDPKADRVEALTEILADEENDPIEKIATLLGEDGEKFKLDVRRQFDLKFEAFLEDQKERARDALKGLEV